MKKTVIKIMLFGLPILTLGIAEILLPVTFFATRPHEALLYRHNGIGMPYYPNQKVKMMSIGDLCTITGYPVKKNDLWITDEIGYRNDVYINEPDVLLFGDSFLLGAGLPQDSMLTNLLAGKGSPDIKYYSLAHASINDFIVLMKNGVIEKPQMLVYVAGEKEIPPPIEINNNHELFKLHNQLQVWIDRATRLYSVNYLMSRVLRTKIKGRQSEIDNRMYFLDGKDQKSALSNLPDIVQTYCTYQEWCDSMRIKFLVVPVPDKESVYYDLVPLSKQNDYLNKLDSELQSKNIHIINSLEVFNKYRQKDSKLIYHLDDTHWNSRGANLIADEIIRYIIENDLLAPMQTNR